LIQLRDLVLQIADAFRQMSPAILHSQLGAFDALREQRFLMFEDINQQSADRGAVTR
jgi:hypothetical protein